MKDEKGFSMRELTANRCLDVDLFIFCLDLCEIGCNSTTKEKYRVWFKDVRLGLIFFLAQTVDSGSLSVTVLSCDYLE